MDKFIKLNELNYFSPFDGLKSKVVNTAGQTYAFWEIDKGTIVPLHSHIHSQVAIVTKGKLKLTVADETRIMEKGMIAVIPSNVPHAAEALTDVEVLDVFDPIREDFIVD